MSSVPAETLIHLIGGPHLVVIEDTNGSWKSCFFYYSPWVSLDNEEKIMKSIFDFKKSSNADYKQKRFIIKTVFYLVTPA